jgi:hypothetical protein
MSGAFSNYMEAQIVEHFLRGSATPFLALYTSNPDEDNSGAEAEYSGYQRQSCSFTSTDTDGRTSLASSVTFAANGGNSPVTITHVGVLDAATGGNLLLYAPLTSAKTLANGDVISFGAGQGVFTLD